MTVSLIGTSSSVRALPSAGNIHRMKVRVRVRARVRAKVRVRLAFCREHPQDEGSILGQT